MTMFGMTIPVRTRLPGFAWALAACITLFSLASSHLGDAQAVSEMKLAAAAQAPQGEDAPGADNGPQQQLPGKKPNETLSEHLDKSQGVIKPPATGDTDIYTTAPNPDPGTTRVIPPPGTPGGNQDVQPK
jgi:hypothetical protein